MNATNLSVTRPMLRYHGGKFLLAPWIISHFPAHRVYTESFGGAASVLLRKTPSYSEVYNDLDSEVVNLFRVCRNRGKSLIKALRLTPFSREEFQLAYEPTTDPLEKARRMVVRAFMGFGSAAATTHKNRTGFRSNSMRSGTTPAHDWKNYPEALEAIIERLRGVVIENKDYKKILLQHDSPQTLHFLDPPYVLDTRYKGQKAMSYRFEMSNQDHVDFCEFIGGLKGMVVVCGYNHSVYEKHLPWRRIDKKAFADGAAERIESLWISPNCTTTLTLF